MNISWKSLAPRGLDMLLYFFPLLALSGSLAYLAIGLYWPLRLALFLACAIGSWFVARRWPILARDASLKLSAWRGRDAWLMAAYIICLLAGLFLLYKGRSNRPLISPWDTVSNLELLAFGLGSLCLLLLDRFRGLPRTLLVAHYLWAFSVFIIVYAIGYGFDPFIHEASVRAIETSGRIAPLTPYYLGQYSLVSIFHGLFGGSLARWSQLLVPGLAALLLPLLWPRRSDGLVMLVFSFAIFTLTTPQNLAYLFLAAIILLAIRKAPGKSEMILTALLAGAALFTQPIAGIPALLLAASLSIETKLAKGWRKAAFAALITAYALAVPAAFYLFAAPGSAVSFGWPEFGKLFAGLIPANPDRESWWLNFTYLFAANRGWLYGALALVGGFMAWRQRDHHLLRRFGWPALALIGSAILASCLGFHFLIEYERADYPLRLLVIAALFALPLAALPLTGLRDRLARQPLRRIWPLYLLIASALAASLYLSYPRFDHYHNSHGYAVSRADVLAVDWIEQDAAGRDYIVLANQQASAAALRELGFKKYYHGDIFFYPIPTGGPLYAQYLAMTDRPSSETMSAAMDLAGVRLAYFILDDYWFKADKIGPEAELIADHAENIAGGQVRVYRFSK